MADCSVTISTKLDNAKLEKELARLTKKILKAEGTLSENKFKKNALSDHLKEIVSERKKLQSVVSDSSQRNTEEGQKALDRFLELGRQIPELEAEIRKYDKAIEESNLDLDAAIHRYDEIFAKVNQLNSASPAQEEQESEKEQVSRVQAALERMKALVSEGTRSLALGIKGIAQMGMDAILSMAKNTIEALDSVKSSVLSLAKYGLKRLGDSFLSVFKKNKSMNASFSSGIKTLLKYGLGIRSTFVLVNKLRAALVNGMKNLAKYSSEVNGSLSMLKSSLTQFKNSMATALAPALNAMAPALSQIINMCSAAADAIARLTAMISGKSTYVRAIAVQEDYAASLEKTGGAAKDTTKSMAGFDEINQLTTKNSSGNSGSADISDMFETVDIEPFEFKSWGEAFSAMLGSILKNGIPKLKSGLEAFTAWLNRFSANLYEMFTFPGVYEKVGLLGTEIAQALNDAVSAINWRLLGQTIGAGANLMLHFLTTAIYSFDWIALGGSLASLVNGIVSEVDWYEFGMLLWSKFKIGIETLAGFLLNLDMAEIAKAASNIAIGFFESMTATVQSINWFQIGEQVKTFLVNVNWPGVATACFTAIGSAFGAATTFLWGLIHDAWSSVVNWWHDAAYEDGKFTLEGLLQGISDVVSGIGTWIKNNIFTPFINGFKAVFGIHSPSTVMEQMGEYMIEGLFNGLKNFGSKISSWGSGFINGVKDFFGIHSPSTEFESLGGYMDAGLYNGVNKNSDAVVSAFAIMFSSITALCTQNVDLMKASIVAFLLYITMEFEPKWKRSWESNYRNTHNSIQLIMSDIDALNRKLASIERNITITITTVYKTVGGGSGASSSSSSSLSKARLAAMPAIQQANIPALAKGAVIPPNREFLAVLGDQRSGNNLEGPEDMFRSIVRQEMGSNNQTLALLQAILSAIKEGKTIEVDRQAFGRVVHKANSEESRRVGVSFAGVRT